MSGMAGNEAGASGEVLGIEELPWGGNISLVGCLEDTKKPPVRSAAALAAGP
jgi:hypothetical protein